MISKDKFKKIFLVLFIIVPAIFFSVLLSLNKNNIGFSKKYVRESTYLIEGMTCTSCIKSVTDTLDDIKYVVSAKVNYDEATVTIKYDSKNVGFVDFSSKLGEDGYVLKHQAKQQLKVLSSPKR